MKIDLCRQNNILSEKINTEDVYLFKVLVDYFALNCCDSFEDTVVITEKIADGTVPYTSNGVTISGFEVGGKICYSISTTQDSNQNYAVLNSDGDVGGYITAEFKITNNKIIYVSPSNECFEALLEENPENVCLLSKIEKISFLDYLQTKINDGTIVDISSKVSNFNVSDFNISDFDFMSTTDVNEKDLELYEVYQAWRLKYNSNLVGKLSELNEFRNFYDSLIKQNISTTIDIPIKYLPSLDSEDFIFRVIIGDIISKHCTPTPTPISTPTPTPTHTPTPTPIPPKIWSETNDTWSNTALVWGQS